MRLMASRYKYLQLDLVQSAKCFYIYIYIYMHVYIYSHKLFIPKSQTSLSLKEQMALSVVLPPFHSLC